MSAKQEIASKATTVAPAAAIGREAVSFSRVARGGIAVAAALLLAAGCSRLSGEHETHDDATKSDVERLVGDAPESLTTRRSPALDDDADSKADGTANESLKTTSPSSGTDAGDGDRSARPAASSGAARKPTATAMPRPRIGNKRPPRNDANEIPDAAEIGL